MATLTFLPFTVTQDKLQWQSYRGIAQGEQKTFWCLPFGRHHQKKPKGFLREPHSLMMLSNTAPIEVQQNNTQKATEEQIPP